MLTWELDGLTRASQSIWGQVSNLGITSLSLTLKILRKVMGAALLSSWTIKEIKTTTLVEWSAKHGQNVGKTIIPVVPTLFWGCNFWLIHGSNVRTYRMSWASLNLTEPIFCQG